jgi:hypothetical protein
MLVKFVKFWFHNNVNVEEKRGKQNVLLWIILKKLLNNFYLRIILKLYKMQKDLSVNRFAIYINHARDIDAKKFVV